MGIGTPFARIGRQPTRRRDPCEFKPGADQGELVAPDWRDRSGIAWNKSAVRAILVNPRYTGHQVWNKQRKDEVHLCLVVRNLVSDGNILPLQSNASSYRAHP
jgi:hypothetical protein